MRFLTMWYVRPEKAQTSLIRVIASRLNVSMTVKLLTGSSESIHVKLPRCWKSHVTLQLLYKFAVQ